MATSVRFLGLVAAALGVAAGIAACAPYLPPGTRECTGLPDEVCQSHIADLEQEGAMHGGVAAYRIVCTSGSCTAEGGDGTETVVFADGTGREGGFGYAVPVGTPPPAASLRPLPVAPACLDVPEGWCREMARPADPVAADWSSITAITVRCTTSCTATAGDGETSFRLADGSEQVAGWSYNGELPPPSP